MRATFQVVLCLVVLGLTAAPALASKYYVVQNTKTLNCSILPKKPKGKTVVLVGSGTPHKTRNDARAALRIAANCK